MEIFGGAVNPISLQKLLFLFTRQQPQAERAYDFVPYKYGCFSFQANQDIATLCKYGYIDKDEHSIWLQPSERHFSVDLNMFDSQIVFSLHDKFKDFSADDLIRYTYKDVSVRVGHFNCLPVIYLYIVKPIYVIKVKLYHFCFSEFFKEHLVAFQGRGKKDQGFFKAQKKENFFVFYRKLKFALYCRGSSVDCF